MARKRVSVLSMLRDIPQDTAELKSFISIIIMYIRGEMGKNGMPLSELWNKKWGVAFCKQVMYTAHFAHFP